MRLKDLVDRYTWQDVEASGVLQTYQSYDRNVEGYRKVLAELKSLTPDTVKDKMRICVHEYWEDDTRCYSVDGKNGTLRVEASSTQYVHDDAGLQEQTYALDGTEWTQWLAMEIDQMALARLSEPAILAHCLWEITFYGFEREQTGLEQA
jgi:hypothetical protein